MFLLSFSSFQLLFVVVALVSPTPVVPVRVAQTKRGANNKGLGKLARWLGIGVSCCRDRINSDDDHTLVTPKHVRTKDGAFRVSRWEKEIEPPSGRALAPHEDEDDNDHDHEPQQQQLQQPKRQQRPKRSSPSSPIPQHKVKRSLLRSAGRPSEFPVDHLIRSMHAGPRMGEHGRSVVPPSPMEDNPMTFAPPNPATPAALPGPGTWTPVAAAGELAPAAPPHLATITQARVCFIDAPPMPDPEDIFDKPGEAMLRSTMACIDGNLQRATGRSHAYRRPGIDMPCCGRDEESHNANIAACQEAVHTVATGTGLACGVVAFAFPHGAHMAAVVAPSTTGVAWVVRSALERQKFVENPALHDQQLAELAVDHAVREMIAATDPTSAIAVTVEEIGEYVYGRISDRIREGRVAGNIEGPPAQQAAAVLEKKGIRRSSFSVVDSLYLPPQPERLFGECSSCRHRT